MEDVGTITVSFTVTVKPEPGLTAADKEGIIRPLILDQLATICPNFDWGIVLNGSLSSSAAETVALNDSRLDYTE